ncbi:hypothetical protein CRENBAI_004179 [Crenichthys baileyi]|uniref:CASAMP N-terminal domain-containing protein n=1 Tax=Crenichthys baileyi TaxID=28760 RepID=A0AAV9S5M7_9TELE
MCACELPNKGAGLENLGAVRQQDNGLAAYSISGGDMGEVQDVRDAKRSFVAPAIKSFEHYDFSRAKICCSLRWLVAKAYGTGDKHASKHSRAAGLFDEAGSEEGVPRELKAPQIKTTYSIPAELKDPFYTDQYEQEHLKPPLASLLQSADLYCRAGSLILKSDAAKPLLGHDAVIQALAQRGLYITDQERLVTERDLRKRPLQMVSRLLSTRCTRHGTGCVYIDPLTAGAMAAEAPRQV